MAYSTYASVPPSPPHGLDALVHELTVDDPRRSALQNPYDQEPATPTAASPFHDPYAHEPIPTSPQSDDPDAHSPAAPTTPTRPYVLAATPAQGDIYVPQARPDSFYPPADASGAPPLVPDESELLETYPSSAAHVYASPRPVSNRYSSSGAAPMRPSSSSQSYPPQGDTLFAPLGLRGDASRLPSAGPPAIADAQMPDTASFGADGSRPVTPQPQAFGTGYEPVRAASASKTLNQGGQILRPGEKAALLSHEQTLELYRKNAKKAQDPDLMYELAVFMIESSRAPSAPGTGEERAELIREALLLLRKISDHGHADAQYFLADCYANGLGSAANKPQFDRAYPLFVLAAKHSHADAAYRAGTCTERGWGCRKDAAKAVQFYKKAAAQGHPGAMFRLAIAELNGELGLKKNAKEGVKWIKLSADMATAEFPHALHELALLHERGVDNVIFVDQDYACELLAQAAQLGYAPSAYKLGVNYEYGKMGCPQDPGLSVHMYNVAAQQSHKEACFALTAWFLVGAPGILPQSDTEAYLWAKRAAEQGLAKAEYAVGYFTEMGIGTHRNLPEAKAWYHSALEHGDKRASTRLATMGRITAATLPTPSIRSGTNPLSPSTQHGTQAGRVPYAYPQTGYQGSAARLPAQAVGPTDSQEDLPVAGTGVANTRPVSQAFGQTLLPPAEGTFENAPAPAEQKPEPEPEQKKKKGWFRKS